MQSAGIGELGLSSDRQIDLSEDLGLGEGTSASLGILHVVDLIIEDLPLGHIPWLHVIASWAVSKGRIGGQGSNHTNSHQVLRILILNQVVESNALDIDLISYSFSSAGALGHSYEGSELTRRRNRCIILSRKVKLRLTHSRQCDSNVSAGLADAGSFVGSADGI